MENDDKKKVLGFVDSKKGPIHYIKRYIDEPHYKRWFDRNYPEYTIYEAVGMSKKEFKDIIQNTQEEKQNQSQPKQSQDKNNIQSQEQQLKENNQETAQDLNTSPQKDEKENAVESLPQRPSGEDIAKTVFRSHSNENQSYDRRTFEEFVDERVLVSRDLFGKKEMKIKILEVSDELQQSKIRWKFGDRVKINKIIVTIKHLDTMQVEEGEFDIEAIEKEIAKKRHYSSTNRWIPTSDIKNGYVINSKHTALISDAVALDYIIF